MAYAPRTAKGPIETPEPTPKMVEMAAKQTIVEEIVLNAYFKFSQTASVTIEATRRGQLDPFAWTPGEK
jgi:hypothetical protein